MAIDDLLKSPYPPAIQPDASIRRPPMFGMAMNQRAGKGMAAPSAGFGMGFDKGLSESEKERQTVMQMIAMRKICWPK